MKPYRILAIDGGGIRGLVVAIVLERLNSMPQLNGWLNSVDLIAGTSSGGLAGLAIAHGLSLRRIRELYELKGPKIFNDSWLDDLLDVGKVIGADYQTTPLRRELRRIFGGARLKDLKKRVLITAYDLDNEDDDPAKRCWKPKLFHNFPGQDSDGEELIYKVGLYTAAAPTYFPSVDGYIDGGVYANNPSMCALAQSQDSRIPNHPKLQDVVLLSFGTGMSLTYIRGQRLDWGYAQWVKPLIFLMLDGVAGIADYQCRQILGKSYHRLAPSFPPGVNIPLDAVNKIPDMVEFAESMDLTETARWIEKRWI